MSAIISYGLVAEPVQRISRLEIELDNTKRKLSDDMNTIRTPIFLDLGMCETINRKIKTAVKRGVTYFSLKTYREEPESSAYIDLIQTELGKAGWDLYSFVRSEDRYGMSCGRLFIKALPVHEEKK